MNTKSKEDSKKALKNESLLEALKQQDATQLSDEDLRAKITKLTSYINKMDMLLNRTEKMLEKELEDDPIEKKKLEAGLKLFELKKEGKHAC